MREITIIVCDAGAVGITTSTVTGTPRQDTTTRCITCNARATGRSVYETCWRSRREIRRPGYGARSVAAWPRYEITFAAFSRFRLQTGHRGPDTVDQHLRDGTYVHRARRQPVAPAVRIHAAHSIWTSWRAVGSANSPTCCRAGVFPYKWNRFCTRNGPSTRRY